jgi:hypothetical protein
VIRLADLTPDDVASAARRAVEDHILRLGWALAGLGSPEVRVPMPSPLGDLAHSLRALTAYAQTGAPLDAVVMEYALSIGPIMYGSAHDLAQGTWGDGDMMGEAEPDSPWGVVLVAAVAREKIASAGVPVTTHELAVLGSLSHVRMRQLVEAREVTPSDERGHRGAALVDAHEARRWLAARGVGGW